MVWQGRVFTVSWTEDQSLYPLVISCDLVSTPLVKDFTEGREDWSGEAGEGSDTRAASH